MIKLTKSQRLILISAFDHELGFATRPTKLTEAAATKIVASLTEQGLAKEVRAKAGAPIWREHDGRGYALKIFKAGREAVAHGSSEKVAEPETTNPMGGRESAPFAGPKTNLIVGLMRRKEGASIGALAAATGWLPHTTRAALSGLRKKGIVIDRSKAASKNESIYRIIDAVSCESA